jgi:hypothetical protein
MDASPSPRQSLRLLVEITRTPEARLEGRIRNEGTAPWSSFSGVLELLKVLEEHLDHEQGCPNRNAPTEEEEDHG